MTEHEWLTCTDPQPMIRFLDGKGSERKFRLFASLCCRRVWNHYSREPRFVHPAVLAADAAADGLAGGEDLKAVGERIGALGSYSAKARTADVASAAVHPISVDAAAGASVCAASYFALTAMESVSDPVAGRLAFAAAERLEYIMQAAFLRELFGNPFRPVILNPAWRTAEVIELARKAIDQPAGRFLLAEALTRAGCHDTDILSHCEQSGGHAKGCWVVDLVLGMK